MKVIFLDIDGVMNSHVFYEERYRKLKNRILRIYYRIKSFFGKLFFGKNYGVNSFKNYKSNKDLFSFSYTHKRLKKETDSKKWKWLIELCEDTGAKICVSSVWRSHFKEAILWDRYFDVVGFPDNTFVGITPHCGRVRGDEIKAWLDTATTMGEIIDKYAIIDDDSDMLPEQMSNFFHVDSYFGLSPNTCYRIKNHFNDKKSEP